MFQVNAFSSKIRLSLNPPVNSNVIGRLQIDRLNFAQLTRLGWQRLRGNIKTPKAFVQKLRQAALGTANFSLTPQMAKGLDIAAVYAAWRDAFEGPAERARLLTALQDSPGGKSDSVLAVYVSATALPGALEDFFEDIYEAHAACQCNLLIVENRGAPLERGLRDRVLRAGATIVDQPSMQLPLHIVTDHALRVDAGAFFFIERRGHFHETAFASFLLAFRQNSFCTAVYSDHDLIDENGERKTPWFKPEWSPDYAMAIELRWVRNSIPVSIRVLSIGFGTYLHCRSFL